LHPAPWRPEREHDSDRLLVARTSAIGLVAILGMISGILAQPVERDDSRPVRERGDVVHVLADVEVPAGTVRDGSVVCVGAQVVIRGKVTGDVVVVLGSLEIDGGTVGRSVTGVLSRLELRDAHVDGDLVNILGGMTRDNVRIGHELFELPNLGAWVPGLLKVLTWLRVVGLLLVFVLLVLLVAIAPERVQLIGAETPVRYVSALFAGLLTYLVLLLFVVPLALVTVIGLPFLVLTYLVLKWLGLAGIFHALGQRVARSFGRDISPLGAVLLVYSAYVAIVLALGLLGPIGLLAIVLFHMLFLFFFEAPALGLIVLTRAGTRAGHHPVGPPPPWSSAPPSGAPPPQDSASPASPSG
jgi:hypothetical protein